MLASSRDHQNSVRDKAGLAHARALKATLDAVMHALESDAALPDKVAPPKLDFGHQAAW